MPKGYKIKIKTVDSMRLFSYIKNEFLQSTNDRVGKLLMLDSNSALQNA